MSLWLTEISGHDPDILEPLLRLDTLAFGSQSYTDWTFNPLIRHGRLYALYLSEQDFPRLPVGMLTVFRQWEKPNSVYVVGMATEPSKQNQGYGTYLLAEVLARLRQQGVESVALHVSPANVVALHLYKDKFGFEFRRFHYQEFGPGEDRLYFEKRLSKLSGSSTVAASQRFAPGGLLSQPRISDGNLTTERLLLLKAALLCYGLASNRYSKRLAHWYNPWSAKRTGHVGVHLQVQGLRLNLPMDGVYQNEGIYTNRSPFQLRTAGSGPEERHRWLITDVEGPLVEATLTPVPSWYKLRTSRGIPMPELFLSEGEGNLMGAIPGPCIYQTDGTPCQFCAFSGNDNLDTKPLDYAEVAVAALRENPAVTFTLTGGNTASPDKGIRRYLPYLRAMVEAIDNELPGVARPSIQLECSPPCDNQILAEAIDAGATSFSINLEFYDEKTRQELCPGKNQIPRADYDRSWSYLVSALGRFRVSSALIYGLEPEASTIQGAKSLLHMGVRPNLIPFKPMPGSKLEGMPVPDFVGYKRVCASVATEMDTTGLDLTLRFGCSSCGACTLEEDILRLTNRRRSTA